MGDRFDRQRVETIFARFCSVMGLTIGTEGGNVNLDYNPIYGGYQIVQYNSVNGGQSEPFGTGKHPPKEFCEMLWFAEKAVEFDRLRR